MAVFALLVAAIVASICPALAVDLCITADHNCPPSSAVCCFEINANDCCGYTPLGNNFYTAGYSHGSRSQVYTIGTQCTRYITTCPNPQPGVTLDCCLENTHDIAYANWFFTNNKRDPAIEGKLVFPNYASYTLDGELKEVEIPVGMHEIAQEAMTSGNFSVFAGWKKFPKREVTLES
ncbi:hypothetical protein DL95DRAFT_413774 [Leptodontidium sp. 2 PMI_412]|nr:hypothetical protein DL95DRAFT_413774 [Leptodontidium sp. 2 PMI_412]